MPSEQVITNKDSRGDKAKRQRVSSLLTQEQLAEMAGIPVEHVNLFERDLPVPLDSRRRILKELWAKRNGK